MRWNFELIKWWWSRVNEKWRINGNGGERKREYICEVCGEMFFECEEKEGIGSGN